jgi:hypothetical protein
LARLAACDDVEAWDEADARRFWQEQAAEATHDVAPSLPASADGPVGCVTRDFWTRPTEPTEDLVPLSKAW